MTEQAMDPTPEQYEDERPLSREVSRTARADVPDRLYILTGGRSTPDSDVFAPVALVTSTVEPTPDMPSEDVAILDMCRTPTVVADIAARLRLPVGVVAILLSDLLQADLITVRQPQTAPKTQGAPWNSRPTAAPEEVPSGLRHL